MAEFVLDDQDCISVLYDGYFNGNFIFNVRAKDESRRTFVFRASKVVFSTKMLLELGYNELISQSADFHEVLQRYSVKYVIQEDPDLVKTPANKRLRDWMCEPEFKLVREFPVFVEGLSGPRKLLVYEYSDYEPKPIEHVELDMPMLGRTISVRPGAWN